MTPNSSLPTSMNRRKIDPPQRSGPMYMMARRHPLRSLSLSLKQWSKGFHKLLGHPLVDVVEIVSWSTLGPQDPCPVHFWPCWSNGTKEEKKNAQMHCSGHTFAHKLNFHTGLEYSWYVYTSLPQMLNHFSDGHSHICLHPLSLFLQWPESTESPRSRQLVIVG